MEPTPPVLVTPLRADTSATDDTTPVRAAPNRSASRQGDRTAGAARQPLPLIARADDARLRALCHTPSKLIAPSDDHLLLGGVGHQPEALGLDLVGAHHAQHRGHLRREARHQLRQTVARALKQPGVESV